MDSHNDLLGELAGDAALERVRFPGPVHRTAAQVPRSTSRADRDDRRSDAHRRGAGLPRDRPGPHVPQPQPLPGRGHRRLGQRDRSHRIGRRARRALQPGRHLRRVRRGRRERRPAWPPSRPPRATCSGVAGISTAETLGIGIGEDPYAAAADSWAAGQGQEAPLDADDDEQAAHRLYDLALEYQEGSQRSEARLLEQFEGMSAGLVAVIGDLVIVDDEDERLDPDRGRPVPCRGRAGGRRRHLADAREHGRAGRVLRPDRRLRRPGRCPRRGLPVGRTGAGARDQDGDGAVPRRRRPRTSPGRDHAAHGCGAGREPGDPAGSVAAVLPRP